LKPALQSTCLLRQSCRQHRWIKNPDFVFWQMCLDGGGKQSKSDRDTPACG
jgi:hypothetical protein